MSRLEPRTVGGGIYFSNKWDVAAQFSIFNFVVECFINIRKPIKIDGNHSHIWWIVGEDRINYGKNDGVILYNTFDTLDGETENENYVSDIVIARYSNQVKLADGRNITFDKNDVDIRYEDGGETNSSSINDDYGLAKNQSIKNLLAPNGKKSNLTPEQWHLVRTPAFKAWFGDWENSPETASKVVDANGEPKVMYHQTTTETKNVLLEQGIFQRGFELAAKNDKDTPYGFYFKSSNKDIGLRGKEQMAFFLNARNPLTFRSRYYINTYFNVVDEYWRLNAKYSEADILFKKEFDENWKRDFDRKDEKAYQQWQERIDNILAEWTKSNNDISVRLKEITTNYMIENGYDCMIIELDEGSMGRSTDTTIVFYPTQIKLADGSNTTFDGSNPDIRYAAGGKVKKTKFITNTDEERIDISIKGIGHVVLTETYPEYEFIEDISEDKLAELGVEEGDLIGKIEHLEINDNFKGQGYAKLLMQKAIDVAKERDLMPLYLNASPMGSSGLDLEDLTGFYESLGFKVFLNQGGNNLMIYTPRYSAGGAINAVYRPISNLDISRVKKGVVQLHSVHPKRITNINDLPI
jgi:GNAT superfamily N-acetyltransferase